MLIIYYIAAGLVAITVLIATFVFIIVLANILSLLITKVPPISTDRKYFAKIFQRLKITPSTVIYDLGCGNGDFLLAAAKFNPLQCIGYELSLMPYFSALIKSIFLGRGKVTVRFKDFFKADIKDADIVYIYLVPLLLGRVAHKLKQELRPGTIAVVKGLPLPDLEIIDKIVLHEKRNYMAYIYRF